MGQDTEPIKVAYADPPYIGCANLYKDHKDFGGEVDHKNSSRNSATNTKMGGLFRYIARRFGKSSRIARPMSGSWRGSSRSAHSSQTSIQHTRGSP